MQAANLTSQQGRPPTILVADDNEGYRELIAGFLESNGYHVCAVADGQAAVEAFQQQTIDLAVLDIVMPRMSGYEACRAIKARPGARLLPVILLTGLGSTDDRVKGIESGAEEFLQKPFDGRQLLARVQALLRLKKYTDGLEEAETVLFALARGVEARDPYTGGHCERLSYYSVELGRKLGLDEELLEALRRGGIVHDVGKVSIPDAILLKEGSLTREEYEIVKQHTLIGESICSSLKSFRHVLPIIRSHHERMDGSGYPDGLRGEQIPLTARILAIVDVYDALTTDRPYRKALSRRAALEQMWEEVQRGWWDGNLLSEFEEVLKGIERNTTGTQMQECNQSWERVR